MAKLGNLVHKVDANFQILAGSAGFMFPAMAVGQFHCRKKNILVLLSAKALSTGTKDIYCAGCVGGVCALGNVLGHETCQLHSLARQGKFEEARVLQNRLIGPNAAVRK